MGKQNEKLHAQLHTAALLQFSATGGHTPQNSWWNGAPGTERNFRKREGREDLNSWALQVVGRRGRVWTGLGRRGSIPWEGNDKGELLRTSVNCFLRGCLTGLLFPVQSPHCSHSNPKTRARSSLDPTEVPPHFLLELTIKSQIPSSTYKALCAWNPPLCPGDRLWVSLERRLKER